MSTAWDVACLTCGWQHSTARAAPDLGTLEAAQEAAHTHECPRRIQFRSPGGDWGPVTVLPAILAQCDVCGDAQGPCRGCGGS